jgi:hypothetical protein
MRTITLITVFILALSTAFAQGVAINENGNPADPSAILDVSATDKGILIPRMTEAERTAIVSPANGLLVYQTEEPEGFYYFNGTLWLSLQGHLELVTEAMKTGYRIKGRDAANHGDIGEQGIDLSYSPNPSTTRGATGNFSMAAGYNTIASGERAFAWGQNNLASGINASAWGSSTTASAPSATAWGNITQATEVGATAWGNHSKAMGDISTAWGDFTEATDEAATAWGFSTKATAARATAWGQASEASGPISTSWGFFTKSPGLSATAWGAFSQATAESATAWGASSLASGIKSTAWGNQTISSANQSTAWGNNTEASAANATAWGLNSKATNNHATAWGNNNVASGVNSTAWGINNTASGLRSTAWGLENIATHELATVWGYESKATEVLATAWGWDTDASGNRSTAWGSKTEASGIGATAWGNQSIAIGNLSTAWGELSQAWGTNSTAWGRSFAFGDGSSAWGDNSIAYGNYSTAFGHEARADGLFSTAIGDNAVALSFGEVVIGRYNTDYTPASYTGYNYADRLFVIGNGLSTQRRDAFIVYKSGRIETYSSPNKKAIQFLNSEGGTDQGVINVYNNNEKRTIKIDGDFNAGSPHATIRLYDGVDEDNSKLYLSANWNNSGKSRIVTDQVQITGGADLSENFEVMASGITPLPGQVVSIDPANAGKLRVASSAYDKTVAGIISGANGVNPGMMMGQSGSIADGDYPVALTGRVYVYASNEAGEIVPGDLLTTSSRPGYAMKVIDYQKAQGAIIGKAMTSIDENGYVLVLVNLQ